MTEIVDYWPDIEMTQFRFTQAGSVMTKKYLKLKNWL